MKIHIYSAGVMVIMYGAMNPLYNPKNISYTLTAIASFHGWRQRSSTEGCTGANGVTLNVLGDGAETHIFKENGEEKGVLHYAWGRN
ncbi:MAG: hypothetical protein ACLU6Y_16220 [Ruminococcus sp.]